MKVFFGNMATVLAVLVVGCVLITGALYVFQRRLLYFPDTSVPDLAGSGLVGVEEVWLETDDGGHLLSWYSDPGPGMPTVLYFHGNAGHIGYRVEKIRPFLDAGYGVLLAGYRGYGGNPGTPSEQGLFADARAAVNFLKRRGLSVANLVVYGESLGSAVATRMAAELATQTAEGGGAVMALILEAPFTSAAEAASHFFSAIPVKWLLRDRFDSGSIIGQVGTPVFILHGDSDRIMPIHFGKKLYGLASSPKDCLWVAGAGHNDLFEHGAAKAVLEFIARQR